MHALAGSVGAAYSQISRAAWKNPMAFVRNWSSEMFTDPLTAVHVLFAACSHTSAVHPSFTKPHSVWNTSISASSSRVAGG